jgi:hypothetical protein
VKDPKSLGINKVCTLTDLVHFLFYIFSSSATFPTAVVKTEAGLPSIYIKSIALNVDSVMLAKTTFVVEEILLGKVFFISRHKYPAITLFTTN